MRTNNINDQLSFLWWYNKYLANKLWLAMLQWRVICILATQLYCFIANQSLFARYVLYHHKNDNWWLMLFGCIWHFATYIYEFICFIHQNNTVNVMDHRKYHDYWLIKEKWLRKWLIYLEYGFKKFCFWLKEIDRKSVV